jgi:hypothetical protein
LRIQWELLLGLFIVNLAVGIVMGLSLPGTAYVAGGPSGVNATDYEAHFNATGIATSWDATPFSGIPVIGDIFAGFSFIYQNIQYLIDGLPKLLDYISQTYIPDGDGQTAFAVIANALRAIYAFLVTVFLIEFISGRVWSD